MIYFSFLGSKLRRGEIERTHEGDEFRRSGHVLGNHHHEDGERQQHGDSERDLLPGVRRQPESDQAERGQPETWKDDVEEIVQSPASDDDGKGNVGVRLHAAGVDDLIAFDADRQQLPLAVEYVVGQVNRIRTIDDVHLYTDRIAIRD